MTETPMYPEPMHMLAFLALKTEGIMGPVEHSQPALQP